MAKVQDEAGHGLYLYSAAETLGVDRRRAARPAARRQAEVLLDLQLPDADVGRLRRDRLARRRRRDHEPGAAVPLLLRPLRPRDDPGLQGGVLPPAAGLRDPLDAVQRHRGPAGDGPGRRRPLVVAGADDVRPARHRGGRRQGRPHRAVDGLGHQALQQRRPAPEVRRHDGAAGRAARARRCPTPTCAATRSAATGSSAPIDWDEFWRVLRGDGAVQRRADRAPASPPTRRARGSARPPPRTPPSRPPATPQESAA